MGNESVRRRMRLAIAAISLAAIAFPTLGAGPASSFRRLSGHVNAKALARSSRGSRMDGGAKISLAVSLSLRNEAQLAGLIRRLHNPNDPLYGHYLTPEAFAEAYAPTQDDVNQVAQFFVDRGLTVVKVHPNRMVIDVEGQASDVENALSLELHSYVAPNGTPAYAANAEPMVAESIAPKITAIAGLNTLAKYHAHARRRSHVAPRAGSGPGGGLSPSDIKNAYGLAGIGQTGAGQALAVFELDGYSAANISTYAAQFGLAVPPLQNVLVDGSTGNPSPTAGNTSGYNEGEDEVELDLELMIAMAPGAAKILVYEGPNLNTSDAQVIDTYNRIATDNLAKSVSTSWGAAEDLMAMSTLNAEKAAFMQMAAQGQSIFAASGDSGAFDDPTAPNTLEVDDPGSQLYVTSVGGTTLTQNAGNYVSETAWAVPAQGQNAAEGGGGGISSVWSLPSWQTGLATGANQGSAARRMVPDVALNADPNAGYSVFASGAWQVYGGTSCAAPLWAGFIGLVNQARAAAASTTIGFANPILYQIASSSLYARNFHDIADSSTNLHFPAVAGYDLATGWGSPVGAALFATLVNPQLPPTAPASLAASPHNHVVTLTWASVTGATSYTVNRATASAGPYNPIAAGVSGTSYADTGLLNGSTYYYEVSGTNAQGTGAMSAPAMGQPAFLPPEAPSGFTATVN